MPFETPTYAPIPPFFPLKTTRGGARTELFRGKMRKKKSFKKAYTPTLAGMFLPARKGKAPSAEKIFSGLEFRPVFKGG